MDFDLEAFSSEVTPFDNSEQDRMMDMIARRKAKLEAQAHAEEVQRRLADGIAEKKAATGPNLESRIRALETTDEELYRYIRVLEGIRYGIWCNKCDTMKKIGGRREEVVEEPAPPKSQCTGCENLGEYRKKIASVLDSNLEELDSLTARTLSLIPILRDMGVEKNTVTPDMLE
jgi:hypothetical protein